MKPYLAYKLSGVPWLGEIPAHWDIVPIRYLSRGVKTGGTPSQEAFTDYPTENDIPWYAPADLNAAFLTTGSRVVSLDSVGEVDIFEPGTIAMVGIGDVGRVSILTTRATGNQQLNFIRPVESVLATFLTYALLAAQGFVQSRANVTLIPILNQENTKRLRMPTPPLDEQQAIATHLDRETARIDTLIAEKMRLIDTLREYRQATISEVVTQGLDPAAPRKPSGVPWLGDVPEHWEAKKVKHITRYTTGWTPPTGERAGYEGSNLWATIADLGERVIMDTKNRISDEAVTQASIVASPVGSLLFSFKLSVGQVSVAGAPLYTNEAIATFIPSESYVVAWAFYAFPAFIPENSAINIYGAKLLNQQRINDAPLVVPPIDEQEAIAAYLDRETARIDTLIAHVQDEIKLLQELRAATITDAVTGKIQVG